MPDKVHLPERASGAAQQNAGVNPRGARRRSEVAQGIVGPTKFIQGSLFSLAARTGVEFGGHHCGQDRTAENLSIFAQPEVVFFPAQPDVNAGVEQEQSGWQ